MSHLKAGNNAPNFTSHSTDGDIALGDVKGNVVLYFYPKDMTPGCTVQAQDFSALYKKFKELDATILGVSKDNLSSHEKFCKKENIPYPLLLDENKKLCDLYGVIKEKTMFGKKSLGIVRTTFLIGKDKKILKVWNSVKASGHAQKVLDTVHKMSGHPF